MKRRSNIFPKRGEEREDKGKDAIATVLNGGQTFEAKL